MNRTQGQIGPFKIFAIGVVAIIGLAACGSDDNSFSVPTTKPASSSDNSASEKTIDTLPDISLPDISLPDISLPDLTLPDGVTIPDGVSIPGGFGGLSGECTAYYQLFASAFAGDTSGMADLDDAVENLQGQVPDDLKDDVAVVATAIGKLAELGKKYQSNPSGLYADPEALALFGDPSFTDSFQNVQTWLDTECATTG